MQSELSGRSTTTDLWILATISFSIVAYHVLTAMFSGYGYFIDELYYIACSKRLALGYVDHPPLSIFLLALTRWLLGDGVAALRLPPALAIGGTAFTAGILARRFGGGRTAMIIAALGVAVMPDYLLMGSFYSMNAFEILLWALILYVTVRLLQESNPKYFVVIGLLSGLGLEMKHTMVLYLVALFSGIALSSSRRILFSRYLFWGIVVCAALLLPNLVWQYLHGFPSLEFYRNAMVNKNIPSGPWKVVLEQGMFANPCALPVWLTGIGVLLFSKRLKKVRSLGWAFLVLLAVLMVGQSSRPDRIGAMYVALFAAGATAFEGLRPPGLGRIVPVCMIV
ncbi:MAG: glycosyltransferase family 39 protein, partial [Bacteroidota bacterium]